jgi:enterochelin esterase-like enzyme
MGELMKAMFAIMYILLGSSLIIGCNQTNINTIQNDVKPVIESKVNELPASELSVVEPEVKMESQVITETLASKALNRNMGVSIYIPPGYSSDTKYPVLYMLYGYGGYHASWFSDLQLNVHADQLIQSDQINPMIIVSPSYGNSFGVNTKPGEGVNPGTVDEGNYEDFLIKELIDFVDTKYSTITTKDGRYIGGASMGGYGALYLGFTYPDLFSKIGGHSSAIWDYTNTDQFNDQRDWLYANEELRSKRDPFALAKKPSSKEVSVYLDAGENDLLAGKNKHLYEVLLAENVPAQYHESAGGHDYMYWVGQLDNYLLFYSGK